MFCGNYVVDPGEQCDPPNEVDCSGTCQTIPPPPPPICAGPSAFGYWKIETELPTTVTGLWATSSNDAWLTTAARPPRYYNDVDVPSQVYRWNGSAWLPVLAGTDISIIYDQVWASGPNDAWVTGTRLRHWDGVAWADVVLPIGDVRVTTFIGGRGPDDVWVGVVSASAGGTLLFHWNGASWTDMTPPPRPDVAASGPRFVWPAASEDVWVIRGLMQPGPYGGFVVVGSDVTRWDGSAWTTATIPVEANLMSIWGSAPDDVWAAGVGMFHFDGHDWTQAVLPRAGSFWRIWGSCATDVWVTGTVPMHFNGGSWSEDLDRPAGLLPISGTSPDDLWIGGAVQTTYGGGAVSHRLLGPIRKCPSPSGIVDLGTLGGTFSQAVDINDAGQVIGATTDVPQNTVPFVWQAGRTYALTASDGAFGARAIAISNTGKIVGQTVANHVNLWEPAGSSWSVGRDIGGLGSATGYRYAYAVNDLGQIVGISATACSSGSCSNHAFFWDPSTGMADLGTLGGPSSGAIDLNNQSQVIGVSATAAGESRGFIWDPAAGLRDLGIDAFVEVRAINAVGQVIGIREVGGVRTGYVWQDGLLRDLDTHGRNVGDLRAINSVGQVVGATSDGVFLWDAVGGTHDLGPGIPLASGKRAMNDLGQLAGGVLNGTGHAAIWTPSIGTCDIGTLGGATSLAVAINAHSQVVGYSGTRTGETHAFLFQLGP
jgi:probable HAF family extracellular repeat protein